MSPPRASLGPLIATLLLAPPALASDAATTPTLAPPAAQPTPEAADAVEDIAARTLENRLSVPVRVNGQGPFRFVVDSGADRSVIGAHLAARLALPAGAGVVLHGMSGTERVPTVRLDRLDVGSNSARDVEAPALNEADVGADGLLGIDALADQRVTLDFEHARMTVRGPGPSEPVAEDEIVVTARRRFGQLILADARIGRDRIYAIVDTGAEVTIGNSALRERIVARRRVKATKVVLRSVTGGRTEADLVQLPRLQVGGVDLLDVPVAFTDAPPFALFGLARTPAMLLGTDVLQSFRRVSLDFKRKTVRFLLKPQGGVSIRSG